MAMGRGIAPTCSCYQPYTMHHHLSTGSGGMLLIMRYSDGAYCCGCLCHHTTDYSDCYHEWSTRLNAMHTTCTALLPPVQVLGVGGAIM